MLFKGSDFLFPYFLSFLMAVYLTIECESFAEDSSPPPIPITILYNHRGRLLKSVIPRESMREKWIKLSSNTPHRALNPQHQVVEFSGPALGTLLLPYVEKNPSFVYSVASDGYVSKIPASLIFKKRTILAIQESAEVISKRRGEQQVVYPTEGRDAIPKVYAEKAAFWPWYVRSFVLDQLQNVFMERNGQTLSMATKPGDLIPYVPPSVFSYENFKCPMVKKVPLVNAIPRILSEKRGLLKLKGLSGSETLIKLGSSEVQSSFLLVAQGKEAIPIECGGPFIFTHSGKAPVETLLPADYQAGIYEFEIISERP